MLPNERPLCAKGAIRKAGWGIDLLSLRTTERSVAISNNKFNRAEVTASD